ncbi:flavin reductase family protein [Falsiroseomonas sp.]|uniref:flavin reductase family protein n=1 Tax=Falsiroseomonas sp. TaxID=2870721 RepID=UPI0027250000|nr:flavin reductase family protein [Falsiroseomonas sp.]MDO9501916.1 flavin reductase family protein [Falsiroseomonas sp.]
MFYEPKHGKRGHGLPFDPIKAIVAPRPIGWISSLDSTGRPNLAPYSFFNLVKGAPPIVVFGSEGLKHSAANAFETREFVFNLVTRPLFDAMNISSAALAAGENEFEAAGLTMAECRFVKAPRVAESPASFECKVLQAMELHDIDGNPTDGFMVLGQVVGIHIDERYIVDGRFDAVAAQTIARCGYRDYAQVTEMFEALRPTDGGAFTPATSDRT